MLSIFTPVGLLAGAGLLVLILQRDLLMIIGLKLAVLLEAALAVLC